MTSKQLIRKLYQIAKREKVESWHVDKLTLGQLEIIQALLKEAKK